LCQKKNPNNIIEMEIVKETKVSDTSNNLPEKKKRGRKPKPKPIPEERYKILQGVFTIDFSK
jgi:hypothetical protein